MGEVGLQLAVFIDTEWLEKARIGANSVVSRLPRTPGRFQKTKNGNG